MPTLKDLILPGLTLIALPATAWAIGGDVNIVVREVRVAPIRAHVGDTVRIEMISEKLGDDDPTPTARVVLVRANGKVVANKLVEFGAINGDGPNLLKETLLWETRGAAPGNYTIRVEAFIWEDSSPFDNFMDVKETLVLVAPGSSFPDGEPGGGETVETDPRINQSIFSKGANR